jgi:hypothetical protein
MRLKWKTQKAESTLEIAISPVCSGFCFVIQNMLHFIQSLDFGAHLDLP